VVRCAKRSLYTCQVPYRWLPQALALLAGIEPYEVLQVLSADRRRPVPAVAAGIRVLTIWGRTRNGRPLIVAVRMVEPFDQLIVGAWEMTADELDRFEEWEAGQ
jgi:hypothetical protein